MDLFKPAWQSKNPQKRVKGIQKMHDRFPGEHKFTLYEIAAFDVDEDVRTAALQRLSFFYSSVASVINSDFENVSTLDDSYPFKRLDALISNIHDDSYLFDIAVNANFGTRHARDAGIGRRWKKCMEIRELSVKKIQDQSLLDHIVSKCSDLSLVAMRRITDAKILTGILDNKEIFSDVRIEAAKRLGNDSYLG